MKRRLGFILPVLAAFGLLAGGLLLNRLPWGDPPGPAARLRAYLDINLAETSETSAFPELRPHRYPVAPAPALALAREAVRSLGWEIVTENAGRRMIGAVVTTPLLRFKDDLTITVEAGDGGGSAVQVRSQSRLGKGDLGANTRHVMDFYAALDRLAR